MYRRLISALVVCGIIIVSSAFAEEKVEKFPDGAKQWVYSVNRQGQKVGPFKEFYPDRQAEDPGRLSPRQAQRPIQTA